MAGQNISTYAFPQLESTADAGRTPDELLAQAAVDADRIRAQAHAEGVAAGHAEGIARAQAESAQIVNALAEAIRAVADTRAELVEKLTRQAGEISLGIAEQVVAGVFAAEPERVIDVSRAALRRLADRHRVTVLVHPDDLELVAGAVQALQTELGGIEHLDVQADPQTARGGATVQTEYGEIDATVEAEMRAAREIVEAALSGDAPMAEPGSDGV